MLALSLLSLLLAPAALAAPWRRDSFHGGCDVPRSAFSLPSNFDTLQSDPSFVLLGIGFQNYTCNANGTYDSVGAVGQMFDVSCLYGTQEFNTIQVDAFNIWNDCPETSPFGEGIAQAIQDSFGLYVDGQHYFVMQNNALVPVWDLTSSGSYAGNENAIVFAQVVDIAPSPDGQNINWVELTRIGGELANTIYRINTVQGLPPPNCNPGDSTSVKYGTKYLLL